MFGDVSMDKEITPVNYMAVDLSRTTLPDQVAKHLLHYIIDKDLKPNDLLPSMAVLTKEFDVSLPVIREALKSLSALGIITVVKGKGALVKPIDDELLRVFFSRAIRLETEPISRLMEVRQPLEIQSATLAAQRHTTRDLVRLDQLIGEMGSNLNNAERYIKLDTEFHLTIALASHNLMLHYLVSSIRTSMESTMAQIRRRREQQGMIGSEQNAHETILVEIKRRNARKAGLAMATHLNETLSLIEHIEDSPLIQR
jgi:GntR family transcriptional regulator, transcriptional repressor for pyruvate dehydrogenase complex